MRQMTKKKEKERVAALSEKMKREEQHVLPTVPTTLGRVWIPEQQTEVCDIDSEGNASTLSVLSWNILAQCSVSFKCFSNTYRPLLKWNARKAAVLKTLGDFITPSGDRLTVDILCLQEVDRFEAYEGELKRLFRKKAETFGCIYKRRSTEASAKKDGSCIIFSKDRFKVVEINNIEFNNLCKDENLFNLKELASLTRPNVDRKTGEQRDYFMRDSVAAVSVLEDANSGQRILVASVHMFWNPSCSDIKILQAMALLRKLDEIASRHDLDGVIVGGDFNSLPNSAAIELLVRGKIRRDHPDAVGIPHEVFDYIDNVLADCKHVPYMRSSYTFNGKQPGCPDLRPEEISTLTTNFHGNLDYILYRSFGAHTVDEEDSLVTKVFSLPTKASCLKDGVTALPAHFHPSDHIPIVSSLKFPINDR